MILRDFIGGLNTASRAGSLAENEYAFAQNLRIRENAPEVVKNPLDITSSLPTANLQNIAVAGSYLVVFSAGKAYYRDLRLSGVFYTEIIGFQMDPAAPKLFFELVPNSSRDTLRLSADGIAVSYFTSNISGTPACMLVQDGSSQPRVIFDDATTRIAKNYLQWSLNDREYIPIGKQMVWSGDILFTVSPNGKKIYRSVTGRPMDYVVAVDGNGDKRADAEATAHTVDYNSITSIFPASTKDQVAIGVGSLNATRMMVATEPIFYGEPFFSNPLAIPSGPLNDESVTDAGGNTVVIDANGLRSFNATKQLQTESNNDVFSAKVSGFFGSTTNANRVVQSITAAVTYDNYAMFAVNTKYGYGILVYDIERSVFVSFDQYEGIGEIKGFRVAKVDNAYRLFFYTASGVYEAFAGDTNATAVLYTREKEAPDPRALLRAEQVAVSINPIKSSGTINAFVVSDRIVTPLGQLNVIAPSRIASEYPLGDNTESQTAPFLFKVFNAPKANNIGIRLEWNCSGLLQSIGLLTTGDASEAPRNAASDRSNLVR